MMTLSRLNQRRWRNFKSNTRAYWSLRIFLVLFGLSLIAEVLANDNPIYMQYRGEHYFPVYKFYPDTTFGGDLRVEADYHEIEMQCLILTGGLEECFDEPEELIEDAEDGEIGGVAIEKGKIVWPIIPYSYDTTANTDGVAPGPPSRQNWLGTDNASRDVLARIIYGFRLSVAFALIVTACASAIGIIAGAIQGFFGGKTDLILQRVLEIWSAMPQLFVIMILFAVFGRSFWLLAALMILFGWPAVAGVVRAEFLRARNFEYVRAAQALGIGNWTIMFRHMLPNAMVATLTLLPFVATGAIGSLAVLDFLGYGLSSSAPSLGELSLQAKQNLQAPWLGFTAFTVFAVMLSLLVFIFEGVRDAFDPRKTFQ